MTIQQLYQHYHLPPQLQRHMLEVAAVGEWVCEHWKRDKKAQQQVQSEWQGQNESIPDRQLIKKALLLHDMGNIVKFRRPFLGEMGKEQKKWEKIQDEFRVRYGESEKQATAAILREIGVEEAIQELIASIGYQEFETATPKSWETRIADYADMSVSPAGIVGFEARLQDLLQRYDRNENMPGIIFRRENASLIEKQVAVPITQLLVEDFSQKIEELAHTVLK